MARFVEEHRLPVWSIFRFHVSFRECKTSSDEGSYESRAYIINNAHGCPEFSREFGCWRGLLVYLGMAYGIEMPPASEAVLPATLEGCVRGNCVARG